MNIQTTVNKILDKFKKYKKVSLFTEILLKSIIYLILSINKTKNKVEDKKENLISKKNKLIRLKKRYDDSHNKEEREELLKEIQKTEQDIKEEEEMEEEVFGEYFEEAYDVPETEPEISKSIPFTPKGGLSFVPPTEEEIKKEEEKQTKEFQSKLHKIFTKKNMQYLNEEWQRKQAKEVIKTFIDKYVNRKRKLSNDKILDNQINRFIDMIMENIIEEQINNTIEHPLTRVEYYSTLPSLQYFPTEPEIKNKKPKVNKSLVKPTPRIDWSKFSVGKYKTVEELERFGFTNETAKYIINRLSSGIKNRKSQVMEFNKKIKEQIENGKPIHKITLKYIKTPILLESGREDEMVQSDEPDLVVIGRPRGIDEERPKGIIDEERPPFIMDEERPPLDLEGNGIQIPKGKKGIVQSVIFDDKKWNVRSAKKWLKENDYECPKVHKTENFIRFRQVDPEEIAEFGFKKYRNKKLPDGIELVIAYRK